jgi:ribosome-binding factor A
MVAAQIRRLVAQLLQRELADPRVDGLISVTRVEVTPDLGQAHVYVSIYGSTRPPATVLQGLKSATRRLQAQVAKQLPLRTAPHLHFELDESLKKQDQMLKLIEEVSRADADDAPAATPAPAETDDSESTADAAKTRKRGGTRPPGAPS